MNLIMVRRNCLLQYNICVELQAVSGTFTLQLKTNERDSNVNLFGCEIMQTHMARQGRPGEIFTGAINFFFFFTAVIDHTPQFFYGRFRALPISWPSLARSCRWQHQSLQVNISHRDVCEQSHFWFGTNLGITDFECATLICAAIFRTHT
jgi:hypothetical protein